MILLSALNLSKTFKTPEPIKIFSDLSLDIHAGESIAITGKSGVGKTTLLHILGTLEPFDSGELRIGEKKLSEIESIPKLRNRRMGFIFQTFNLLDDFTALENVLMPARIAREPLDRNRAVELLSLVDLSSRANFPAKLLSGGERQRVAIARALCNDPDLLFADEPSGNLDSASAESVSHLLFDLVRSFHKTLILVTHDMDLAARCSRKFCLSQGKLLPICT
jgi:lipoprotein-releasing system ATP-binding protein